LNKEKKYNGNNYEFKEIIDYNPNWIIRWGITLITFIAFVLIFISIFINEPEIIKSKYIIYTDRSIRIKNNISKDSNDYHIICKLNIEIFEKNKLSIGKYVEAVLKVPATGGQFNVNGRIDSIKYNPEVEKYEISMTISSGLPDSIMKELMNNNKIDGLGNIIIENISLFDRIFNKYNTVKKF
jgi:hypothetical protein